MYRCCSSDRAAPWDSYRPCREPGSAGQVSDHRLAADRVSDPAIDLAGRVGFGSSCCFLSWERPYNDPVFGFVPIKEKAACMSPHPWFRDHHTNTQAPPNEQAGTVVSAQPLATRAIGSLSSQHKECQKMSNANQSNQQQNSAQQQNGKEQIEAAGASISAFPGGFQAIATAYGDYTKKSFEDTRSFVEKLSGVKSFEKAVEIQTEFAKTAYETFMTESQKIGALYGDLAKQSYKPFSGFAAKMTPTNR
jgi:hypothetical protein